MTSNKTQSYRSTSRDLRTALLYANSLDEPLLVLLTLLTINRHLFFLSTSTNKRSRLSRERHCVSRPPAWNSCFDRSSHWPRLNDVEGTKTRFHYKSRYNPNGSTNGSRGEKECGALVRIFYHNLYVRPTRRRFFHSLCDAQRMKRRWNSADASVSGPERGGRTTRLEFHKRHVTTHLPASVTCHTARSNSARGSSVARAYLLLFPFGETPLSFSFSRILCCLLEKIPSISSTRSTARAIDVRGVHVRRARRCCTHGYRKHGERACAAAQSLLHYALVMITK